MESNKIETVKKFLIATYTGDTSLVDSHASENIKISYPIFTKIFNSPLLEGKEKLKNFITHFAAKFTDGKITIHETVSQDNNIIFIWSFDAVNTESGNNEYWGGITLYKLDSNGKISLELGEESTPGPVARLQS